MSDLPYRPNVCILLCNQNRHLFIGERAGEPGHWQFPQGGVEAQVSLEENALREIEEETGIPKAYLHVIKKLDSTHRYDFRRIPDYAKGKFRGQEQTFWVIEFRGGDHLINLETEHPEFANWAWCPPDEIANRVSPLRMPGYEGPLAEFCKLIAAESKGTP